MKWVNGIFVGFVVGLVIAVITFTIFLSNSERGGFLYEFFCTGPCENAAILSYFTSLLLAIIAGVFVAIVGFILTVWYQGKKEAEEDSS